jgi:hypothetical protein
VLHDEWIFRQHTRRTVGAPEFIRKTILGAARQRFAVACKFPVVTCVHQSIHIAM